MEFVVVETKRFVGSNVNVILTLQTCGLRSSISAGSKRQALAFHFCERICHVFPGSKYRGESDLNVCTTCVLAKGLHYILISGTHIKFFMGK